MERTEVVEVVVTTVLGGEDERIVLDHWYGESKFRVHTITESFTQGSQYSDGYRVEVRGPRQTSKGKDHASSRGDRTWSGPRDGAPPPEIAALCLGRDVLASRLASS